MSRVLRVDLRFDGDDIAILAATPIEAPEPLQAEVPEGADALEVRDPAGATLFAARLPDLDHGGESLDEENRMQRTKRGEEPRYHSVEVPWGGEGSTLAIRREPPAGRRRRRAPGAPQILPLEPRPVRRRRGDDRFPVRIDPIWGHDNPKALTLAFMAEAFTAAQMADFHAAVDRAVAKFAAIEPFRSMQGAMRVARIETPSQDGEVGGRTMFGSHFQASGPAGGRTLRFKEEEKALKVVREHIPTSARGLIVVNTTTYGGSGGATTMFSLDPTWSADIAVHEFGHSHFDLADEYIEAGQPGDTRLDQPNVSDTADRAKLKWRHLIDAATPLPTWRKGDPVPTAQDVVGAFQGAKYQPETAWRPSFDCKMNHINIQHFCRVCEEAIRTGLTRHMP